ncbi:hypothetical protein [uncultured Paracoccus sp.]|uniref:hypothetical protein n=1 Tax=uncultured Paracoccus sp. TaxID=189685 RepID=UPI0025F8EC79|nr:hypothetical protein [uncultured Paracoccus sp.]
MAGFARSLALAAAAGVSLVPPAVADTGRALSAVLQRCTTVATQRVPGPEPRRFELRFHATGEGLIEPGSLRFSDPEGLTGQQAADYWRELRPRLTRCLERHGAVVSADMTDAPLSDYRLPIRFAEPRQKAAHTPGQEWPGLAGAVIVASLLLMHPPVWGLGYYLTTTDKLQPRP